MKVINNFTIDISQMPSVATTRSFVVRGDVGAEFTIIALQDATLKYYNFKTKTFELGHSNNSNLNIKMTGKRYQESIDFPSGGGDYVVKLITREDTITKNNVISKSISKASSQADVTFTMGTVNTSNYSTFPTTVSTGDENDTATVLIDWDIDNASTDAGGFGLRLKNPLYSITASDWYFTTTEAVADNPAGDGEDSTTVTVADLTNLCVGMELYYHKATTVPTNKAGSAVGTTTITSINTTTKTLTFSQAVAFEDTETMTFRAYGQYISDAIGLSLNFTATSLLPHTLTHTVRANVSNSTSITLNSTHGVSGGNVAAYNGRGVDSSSSNKITSVTPDCPDPSDGTLDNDGVMVVQKAQTLTAGTVLTFEKVFKKISFGQSIKITKYPSSNVNIYLDLDKLITVGTAS
tara:strand:+ start:2187 stop:3410 length:1224 start_codon:yes stop_codon:yes gene_type:complete